MIVREKATLQQIESLLVDLGSGNHEDNLRVLRAYSRYYLVELTEAEFMNLVFLQNDHVSKICPRGEDRALRTVSQRALQLRNSILHANWNLAEVENRTRDHLQSGSDIRPIVLRPACPSERCYGDWYIQDGSHTALGYAMALTSGETTYAPVSAYIATDEDFPRGAA